MVQENVGRDDEMTVKIMEEGMEVLVMMKILVGMVHILLEETVCLPAVK